MARVELATLCLQGRCNNHYATPAISVIPVSLGGQDSRLSPDRPGFNSRSGNFFLEASTLEKIISRMCSKILNKLVCTTKVHFLLWLRFAPGRGPPALFQLSFCARGAMDSASDFESGGCGFESRRAWFFFCSACSQKVKKRGIEKNIPGGT